MRALAASLQLDARLVTFWQFQGWVTTLPLAYDNLTMRRTLDTPALAAAFRSPPLTWPPNSALLPSCTARTSPAPPWWDRFARDNHNSVILAHSVAGKSYLAKLETPRSFYVGIEVAVIDPEDEYVRLCSAVGGAYLHLGASKVRLNPFDLPSKSQRGGDPLTRRALFPHTLIAVMLGEPLSNTAKAVRDRAILATYRQAGITPESRIWNRRPPLLRDLPDQDPGGRPAGQPGSRRTSPVSPQHEAASTIELGGLRFLVSGPERPGQLDTAEVPARATMAEIYNVPASSLLTPTRPYA